MICNTCKYKDDCKENMKSYGVEFVKISKCNEYEKKEADKMKNENDIKYHITDGIPDEMIKAQEDSYNKAADILDNYASKLSTGDDIALGKMSVSEYEDLITAIRYAISYLRGGSK